METKKTAIWLLVVAMIMTATFGLTLPLRFMFAAVGSLLVFDIIKKIQAYKEGKS